MDKRSKIIAFVQKQFSKRFRVIDNTGTDKKVVAGQFPDIIFMRPEPPPNSDIMFVMKIEMGSKLVDSVSEWQALGGAPSVLYVVVPSEKLDEAKKLASATNVRARFASYEMDSDEVRDIKYE